MLVQNVQCSCDIFPTEIGYSVNGKNKIKNQIAEESCVICKQ